MLHIRFPQPRPNKVHSLFSLFVAALLLNAMANSGEVFKWTDSAGKIHYGDKPFGQTQATRVDVPTSPEAPTAAPMSAATGHDGGYSDTLNICLSSGGTNTECVARASAAQTEKAANERRMREQANRNRAQNASYQRSAQTFQPTANTDFETARRAAEQARQRSEQREREMRWR